MPSIQIDIDIDDVIEAMDPIDVLSFCESAVEQMGRVDQQSVIDVMDDDVVIDEARDRMWADGEIDGAIDALVDAARYGTRARLLAAVERLAQEARGVTLVLPEVTFEQGGKAA